MAKSPVDSRVLAAVQAAHFERWRRLYSRSPVFAPAGYERMLPESAQSVPALLNEAKKSRGHFTVREQRFRRQILATLIRARSDEVAKRVDPNLVDHPNLNGTPTAEALAHAPNGMKRWLKATLDLEKAQAKLRGVAARPPQAGPVCRCAGAYEAGDGVACHSSSLSFDPDTYVSEATEIVVVKANREDAARVIHAAKPPNWAKVDDDAGDFFKETYVVEDDGETSREVDIENLQGSYYLREKAGWQLNRNFGGSSDVVLSVTDQVQVLDGGLPVELSFKYRLRECKETQLFLASSRGGINVDDGETDIKWVQTDGDDGLLYVTSSKKLRFASTREISSDQATALNLMAPAMLSMLMQRLAIDGVLGLVKPKAQASPPSVPPPILAPPAAYLSSSSDRTFTPESQPKQSAKGAKRNGVKAKHERRTS